MELLPSFETERLFLRERTLEDMDDCIEMDLDIEVVKYIPEIAELINGGYYNQHRAFVRKRMETVYPPGMGYWVIESKENPAEFLGWVLLIPIDNRGPEIEIGWRLKRKYWGKGYATEAARVILQHAFDTPGLEKIVADIHYMNHGSIRVAEKLGLKAIGTDDDTNYRRYCIYKS
ncbi:GNAT family N-acetyltransferase [Halobacillus sp. MO56]